jgi:hypothetical protein
VQSIATKRVPPRCHAVEQCAMAQQPTSLPAVRSTATFLVCDGVCSIQSDNCFSMLSLPVRGRVSLLFERNVWVSRQSRFSNDPIENATRCVPTAAELTRSRIKRYRGRGFAVCEPVYIRRNFFLAGRSPVGFCEGTRRKPVRRERLYGGWLTIEVGTAVAKPGIEASCCAEKGPQLERTTQERQAANVSCWPDCI